MKKLHYLSGIIISIFVGLHLFNHCFSILGANKHIELMTILRHFYRNVFVEAILLSAVVTQLFSGLNLFRSQKQTAKTMFEKLHIWSGLYLALFFAIHVAAVLVGRIVLNLDTNFYFGVAGINSFPFNLFFIPYYFLAVSSFFGHISAIHVQRMTKNILGLSPYKQGVFIFTIGISFSLFLIFGLTNMFQGFDIPSEYQILIGK